jgi:hypothetical protein
MADEIEEKPQPLSDEDLGRMLAAKEHIRQGLPRVIAVDGKTYTVRQISKGVRARIHTLELEAYQLSGKQKEAMPLRKAKNIQHKLDTLHAKTATYYLLGNRAVWMPWLFALTWRKLMCRPEEHTFQINNAAVNDEEVGFSSANWDITRLQLALSMRPIGDGVRQTLKRWESALEQTDEDATKKKEADSKSAASSPKRPTTRR